MDTTRLPPRRLLLLSAVLLPLALASPALAQDVAAAEALFNRGMADLDAGRYDTACRAIAESQRLDPRPGTLFTLAVCETRWGHIATAVTHYGDYLALYDRLTPGQQARQGERLKEARKQREALAPLVPELTLVLPPTTKIPAGTIVSRDGAVMSEASLGIALPVDPGEHLVTTQAPGGPLWEKRITIEKGEKKTLTLEVKPPKGAERSSQEVQQPTTATTKTAEGPSGRRVAAYVVGGMGIAGLALGGVMGGLTFWNKGKVADHCGSSVGSKDETACDATGLDAVKSGRTTGLVSTIALGVGAAGVGVAVVLLLTAPAPPKPATGASRRWVTAGVLGAGPAGAVLGVRGGW